jgi:hypothetical protein
MVQFLERRRGGQGLGRSYPAVFRQLLTSRVYFGKDGDLVIVLLGGGTKKRQDADIEKAIEKRRDYRRRKRQEI